MSRQSQSAAQNAPETEPANPATGTPETEAKKKAAPGSSLTAQCKHLVSILANEIKKTGAVAADTLEWLYKAAGEISEKSDKGLPLSVKLEKAQARRNELYLPPNMAIVDGAVVWGESVEDEITALTQRIERLKREIKKENEEKAAKEKAAAEQPNPDSETPEIETETPES